MRSLSRACVPVTVRPVRYSVTSLCQSRSSSPGGAAASRKAHQDGVHTAQPPRTPLRWHPVRCDRQRTVAFRPRWQNGGLFCCRGRLNAVALQKCLTIGGEDHASRGGVLFWRLRFLWLGLFGLRLFCVLAAAGGNPAGVGGAAGNEVRRSRRCRQCALRSWRNVPLISAKGI